MITIVGLGNPGDEYCDTRHNIGWLVLDAFVHTHGLPKLVRSNTYNALLSEGMFAQKEVTVFLPLTFMNKSGSAVRKRVGKEMGPAALVVVHDDVDLPFGVVRIGVGRGAGGHNGVQSIIDTLGSNDFIRVRVGVGKKNIFGILKRPRGDALSDFVLGKFTQREMKEIEETIAPKVDEALVVMIAEGVEKAMQKVNKV